MKVEMMKTALQNIIIIARLETNNSATLISSSFTLFQSCLSKCLLALENTTSNQEVKRSLYRLQNVNNLPKDYICTCLTSRSLAEFNFIGLFFRTSRIHLFDFINISDHRRLINSNLLQRKSLIFCCVLKNFDLINQRFQYRRPRPHSIGLDSGVRNKGIQTC